MPGTQMTELGRHTFTQAGIVRFARAYDPQPFHVDLEAAAASHFGGLVASGWHTLCTWMGLFVRAHGAAQPLPEDHDAAQPLPGDHAAVIAPVGVGFNLTDVRFPAPVRVDDTIVFFTQVLDARPSGSRPGWTIYHRRSMARREDGTCVLAFELRHIAPDPA